jgi:hypothetical protein
MFPVAHLTAEALKKQAKALGGCNQDILERSLYALTLLGHLADSGLPFFFKGGTSLLLHLPQVRRLSIDIDIVCGEKPEVVDGIVQRIGKMPPFIRSEEHVREHVIKLPQRRHFKFVYRSAIGADARHLVIRAHAATPRNPPTSLRSPVLGRLPGQLHLVNAFAMFVGVWITAKPNGCKGKLALSHPDGLICPVAASLVFKFGNHPLAAAV